MGLAAAEGGAKYPGEAGPGIFTPPRPLFHLPWSLVWRADSDATTRRLRLEDQRRAVRQRFPRLLRDDPPLRSRLKPQDTFCLFFWMQGKTNTSKLNCEMNLINYINS